MAKSYRTAFIRVTAENNTSQGMVMYNVLDIKNNLVDWAESSKVMYWLIEHEADEEITRAHFHIVLKFKNPVPFDVIKNRFPYGDIESARSVKSSVQYLIHMNDKSKKQYPWENIITNCQDMTPFKVQSQSQQEITLEKVFERIDKGEIREYNRTIEIPNALWSRHKSKIENSLGHYRERICMDKHREIEVVFITGDTGAGKTTFAKQYCHKANMSYCISSSSNDPMQDYKGEDVLILDDLRDDDFKYNDLLKVLDNHTKSSVRSRYNNKAFIGQIIIITSFKPLNNWYHDLEQDKKQQLYRRIRTMYKMTKETIEYFEYSPITYRYEFKLQMKNIVIMRPKEQAKMGLEMLKVMGLELTTEQETKLLEMAETKITEQIEFEEVEDEDDFINSLFDMPKKK